MEDTLRKLTQTVITDSQNWKSQQYEYSGALAKNSHTFVSYVLPDIQVKQNADPWILVEDSADFQQIYQQCTVTNEAELSCHDNLAVMLHQLADSLQHTGSLVDLVWLVSEDLPDITEEPAVFGTIKRLMEWYHAHVNFVTVNAYNNADLKQWLGILCADVKHLDHENGGLLTTSVFWRGSVQLTEAQISNSVTLQGFSLHGDCGMEEQVKIKINGNPVQDKPRCNDNLPQVLGRSLELLQILNLDDFPKYLVSSRKFKLYSEGMRQRSRALMMKLKENRNTCYLMRLRHGNDIIVGKTKYDTDTWKELILQDANNISSVPEVSVKGVKAFYYFLLVNEGNSVDVDCTAYLLHDPTTINGSIYQLLTRASSHHQVTDESSSQKVCVKKLLAQLPHFSAAALQHMQQQLEYLQLLMLQTYTDSLPSGEVPNFEAFSTILSAVRLQYKEHMKLPKTKISRGKTSIPHAGLPSELDIPSSNWIVRCMFRHQEFLHQQDKKQEGPGGLAPPKEQALSIDPWNFLLCFQPNGSEAKSDNLCPIKLKPSNRSGVKLRKYESEEARHAAWPASRYHVYHDIYYNLGVKSELSESECHKLQTRLINQETASIFTNKATVAMTAKKRPSSIGEMHQDRGDNSLNSEKVTRTSKNQRNAKDSNNSKPIRTESKPERRISPRLNRQRKSTSEAANIKPKNAEVKEITNKHDRPSCIKRNEKEVSQKESRSARHKRKLEMIVRETLSENGITTSDPLLEGCARRLYILTKSFVKDLKSSYNLKDEMKKIACSHVKQVIEFEKANAKSNK